MLTGFFQDSDFIVVLQTGFGSRSGFLPLGSGLESDSKKPESEHLCHSGFLIMRKATQAFSCDQDSVVYKV